MNAPRVHACAPPGERVSNFECLGPERGAGPLGVQGMSDEERDQGQRGQARGPFQDNSEKVPQPDRGSGVAGAGSGSAGRGARWAGGTVSW